METDERRGQLALERGLDLLELLSAESQAVGFNDLQQRLGIPRPVLSRLLKSLLARGYLVKDEETRRYGRGPGMLRLAAGMEWSPHSRKALAHYAGPHLHRLKERFGQSLMALHWSGSMMECVASAVPDEGLACWATGTRRDGLERSPWGWLCACLERPDCRQRLAALDLEQDRIDTIVDAVHIHERLGWIADAGHHCHKVAAGVRSRGHRLTGVLAALVNPLAIDGYTLEALGEALADSARSIALLLGWQPTALPGSTPEPAPMTPGASP